MELQVADLSILSQVRGRAAEVGRRHRRLDILINNVGARKAHRELTPGGLGVTFAINQ
jgi:NAD(P)-dependent dehydrogenase (short-subunit alcohol dehydrogenase family)